MWVVWIDITLLWDFETKQVPKPVICSTVTRQIMIFGISVSRERKVCSYGYHIDEAADIIGLQIPMCKMEHLSYGLRCC